MSDLTFQSPLLLLLLPAAVAPSRAAVLLWKRRMGAVTMSYADTGLLPGTRRSLRLRLMPFVSMLRYLALAMVIVAAARPQLADAREIIRGEGVDIAIALDVSGSMGETDFEPNRLGAAKEIIADFISERRYDRIGLVVFSREAFIQSPPTLDHGALDLLLRDVHLAGDMRIEDGTAIGSGMATAANMLKDSSAESKLVTLITDGVNNAGELDPITVATAAEAVGIKLYTIGVGRDIQGGRAFYARDHTAGEPARRGDAKGDLGYHQREVLSRDRYGGAEGNLRRDQRPGKVGCGDTQLRPLPGDPGLVPCSGSGVVAAGAGPFEYRVQKTALSLI